MGMIQGLLDLLRMAKTGSLKIILLTMIEEEIFIQMGSLKTGNLKNPITAVGIRRKLNRQLMLQQQQQHKINDILKGKGRETKGAAHQYEKAGDFDSVFT